jgi:hypothetical protein
MGKGERGMAKGEWGTEKGRAEGREMLNIFIGKRVQRNQMEKYIASIDAVVNPKVWAHC